MTLRELANEQFGRFLVTTDFTERDGTGTVTMGFLDSSGGLDGSATVCTEEEGSHTGADLRAALLASCLRGALPPVDLRAVCYTMLA
jgi:hypothetical protein